VTPTERSQRVKQLAEQQGFDRCGIAPLGPIDRADYLLEWLQRGMAGTMGYLHRRRESRHDPSRFLPGARSAIVVAVNYHQPPSALPADGAPRGRVAQYAWGEDYHVVVRERLEGLLGDLRSAMDELFEARVCVDTSAIVERALAARAGVGWIGKNTLVLHESLGSYFFLGEILLTLDLAPDHPAADHCGSCTRCLEACPTGAFPAPYQMDARRCISYLTIEHRGEIPGELHAGMGDWIFGCDICQEVCPFNRDAPTTREPRFALGERITLERSVAPGAADASPRTDDDPNPRLDEVLAWDADAHRATTQGRATDRATLAMWRRNAAIARANIARDSAPASS